MASRQQENIPEIRATASTPEEISWIEHQRKENQEVPHRLEETAKYLSGLSSISLTIILGPYSDVLKEFSHVAALKVGILCWLISILLTLAVVFPFPYQYVGNSESSIREMNRKISKVKFISLLIGSMFYFTGICIVAYICLHF